MPTGSASFALDPSTGTTTCAYAALRWAQAQPAASTRLSARFSGGVDAALLYADNLTDAFFDLSSGQAGAILQKLRNYGVRLAVVSRPGSVQFSSRFGEMLAEERQGRYFGLFETRRAAREWLGRP
jgi:hypothetical protein